MHVLPFEKPIADLCDRVRELRGIAQRDASQDAELDRLEAEVPRVSKDTFRALTPHQKVQLSRHPNRPFTLDYVKRLVAGFVELHGDRRFADDASIVAGLGTFRGRNVAVVGHQKGRGTKENMKRNFGMPHPEGYRKAIRLYELADRFNLPILTFIDTPGAYPGIGAEERGQSEAIGAALQTLARVRVPVIASIIGEGGSGGALALGVANRVIVLEFGCYSVISPEGCAAILWKDGARAEEAAERLKMTAPDLLSVGVVDEIVEEPPGAAHQDADEAARRLEASIARHLDELDRIGSDDLPADRYRRFRGLGAYLEA
ncbi:MAG: acetyl-CoA carboxylase carboxyltransferase subunit alpha [Myxococcales bacterium]|nr:acetyl-CoA carboxylase carboxyltransferase subunit alpha [Myxococcales bacterium]